MQSVAGNTTRKCCCTGISHFSIVDTRLQIPPASILTASLQSCLAAVKERLLAKSKSADQARLDCNFLWAGLLATSRRASLLPASARGHQYTWWVSPLWTSLALPGTTVQLHVDLYVTAEMCRSPSTYSVLVTYKQRDPDAAGSSARVPCS